MLMLNQQDNRLHHQNNRLLASLPPDVLAILERDLRQVLLVQGSVIVEAGQSIENVYFPLNGLISLLVVTKDGGTVEAATVGREGALGVNRGLGLRRAFTRAVTQIGGYFSVMRAGRFSEIVQENGHLRDLISNYTEVLLAEAQQLAACNAVHNTSSRLCRWLLQSADRTDNPHLPLTQEYLAQMLGVRRTTVTLLAQELQQRGLIKYSRGRITIVDRAGLEASACECYHVVRQDSLPRTLGVNL